MTPLMAFANLADRDIDQFFRIVDRLLYHDHDAELLEALTSALPLVDACDDIMDHGKMELRNTAVSLILRRHLARMPELTADDPELVAEAEKHRLLSGHPWWNFPDILEPRARLRHFLGWQPGGRRSRCCW